MLYGIVVQSDKTDIGSALPNYLHRRNGRCGILVKPKSDGTVSGTVISGNRIGTNADGSGELDETSNPEQLAGILLQDDVRNTEISSNLISGHKPDFLTRQGGIGIVVVNKPSGTVIQYNKIGTNAAGLRR